MWFSRSKLIRNLHAFMKAEFCIFSFVVLVAFLSLLSVKSSAQGNLLITPRRIVLTEPKDQLILILLILARTTATYQISLVQIRMKEDGGLKP